jgi:hypothetical protein
MVKPAREVGVSAVVRIKFLTCVAVSVGQADQMRAAVADTTGAAKLVPLTNAKLPSGSGATMREPGAIRSTEFVPKSLKFDTWSFMSEEPTEMTFG